MERNKKEMLYAQNVRQRSCIRYMVGLIPRLSKFLIHEFARLIARANGAVIGEDVVLPLSLAIKANKNLVVGDHTSIQTDKIDLRSPVRIGNNVIIGINTEIITTSHNIDSGYWEHKYYGILIEDYAWIPTKVLILPSCEIIGRGAVVGSGSVVVKNIESMSVVSGSPAVEIRKRKCVHSHLIVESLLGGDLKAYIRMRKKRTFNHDEL